jgi:aspartate/methionine/tyrosine aminotransferase
LFTSPGADYGKSGEGHLRMVYASLDEKGIQQLVKTLQKALALYPTCNHVGG